MALSVSTRWTAHSVLVEPGRGAVQEPGAGGVALVGEGLDVGEAGVVVDRDVQEVVAHGTALVPVGDGGVAPVQAPAAAVGDPAELLHIDMEQLTGAARS